MGPGGSLAGRDIGQDFAGVDGWRMYHGQRRPRASPSTPTVASRPSPTCARASSTTPTRWARRPASAGATCSGSPPAAASCTPRCSRSLDRDGPNPVELFQIWLNLPAADKMVDPHFAMLWDERHPPGRGRRRRGPHRGHGDRRAARRRRAAGPAAPLVGLPRRHRRRHLARPPRAGRAVDGAAGGRRRHGADAVRLRRRRHRAVGGPTSSARRHRRGRRRRRRPSTSRRPRASRCSCCRAGPSASPSPRYGPFVMNDRAGIDQALRDYQPTGSAGGRGPATSPCTRRSRAGSPVTPTAPWSGPRRSPSVDDRRGPLTRRAGRPRREAAGGIPSGRTAPSGRAWGRRCRPGRRRGTRPSSRRRGRRSRPTRTTPTCRYCPA